mmetsp:Transcript_24339/g.76042  ORF Transcript_24339/g.76042 Transcript_24339/m.76042 type:complete len:82 (+) Transcript_24339:751-996(+)
MLRESAACASKRGAREQSPLQRRRRGAVGVAFAWVPEVYSSLQVLMRRTARVAQKARLVSQRSGAARAVKFKRAVPAEQDV